MKLRDGATVLIVILALLAVSGCGRFAKAESEPAPEPEPEPTKTAYNVIHRVRTYVRAGEKDGQPVFERSSTLPRIGEELTVLGEELEGLVEGSLATMTKVQTDDGTEIWMRSTHVVPDGRLAVVVSEDAVLYSEPDQLSPTTDVLPRGTIVTVFPEPQGGEFVKLTAWEPESRLFHPEEYLRRGLLSMQEADVRSALLLYVAERAESDIQKEELLKSAAAYEGSAFAPEIQAELARLEGEEEAPASSERPTRPVDFRGVINASQVRVRDLPTLSGSEVITELDEGTAVTVVARTLPEDTIRSVTAPWYRITEPEGWVFGAFIDPE